MAELAFAYTGSLDYEVLKRYPQQEIMLLTDTMNAINQRRDAAVSGKSKTMNMDGTQPIGDFQQVDNQPKL